MRKPNILVFMTDHQRADTVLPEHPAITPHLDRFTQEGVTFTNTFCPSPHCCPSRATFHTGLYPSRHGVWNNVCNRQALSRGLNEGVRLWSEDLADAGYQLHFSGKWHVSVEESPQGRGHPSRSNVGPLSQTGCGARTIPAWRSRDPAPRLLHVPALRHGRKGGARRDGSRKRAGGAGFLDSKPRPVVPLCRRRCSSRPLRRAARIPGPVRPRRRSAAS